MTKMIETREEWLLTLSRKMIPLMKNVEAPAPAKYRVSCGWPSKSPLMRASKSSRRIGECWSAGSADGTREIFISPALVDPVEVAGTLLHEMVHAALPVGVGHKHPFPSICKKLGFEGKPTSNYPGDELKETLKEITDSLGPYPHARLDQEARPKQKARMMKVECPDCGYTLRAARSWIDVGLPTCACGAKMDSLEYDVDSSGLAFDLAESHSTYRTKDGRYEISVAKRKGDTTVYAQDLTTGQLVIREDRQEAAEFIARVIAGESHFPSQVESIAYDDEGDYLDDDEHETPDYEDGIYVEGQPDAYPEAA